LDSDRIENLFFNLASESRTDILYTLSTDTLRMNEIARKIDITATEASRQIQRLLEESLILKQPDSTYTLTNYGKLVLHMVPSLDFVFKHKHYFLNHDVWRLPPQFINRLGELSKGILCEEIAEIVDGIENMMQSSEDYVYVITDQVMSVHNRVMTEQLSKGIKFRAIIHERLVDPSHVDPSGADVDRRVLSSIPGLLSITEKEALVAFLTMDGKVGNAGFFGSDASFLRWAKDLFLYYWDIANRRT
jgi:predicted transcriptional regulator